ncbi:MAG: acyl-CoA dehydratase activase-related protein [Planctomycetota bacterium]|jgi:predicted nucleotide-binding protein (sugar kinase/HSP70/actin superfamily)
MRITYPHIGDLTPALEGLFDNLGIDFIPPPPPGTAVLARGAKHSPETVCLPYKHVLGELIINLEKGADTLMLLGGRGPCRFGFYDVAHKDVLEALGHTFTLVSTDNPDTLRNLVQEFRTVSPRNSNLKIAWEIYLFFRRIEALDRLQDAANRVRFTATDPRTLDQALSRGKTQIAGTRTLRGIQAAAAEAMARIDAVPLRPRRERPLSVGIIGEFYTVVDPHTNFHVERILADLGVEVRRGIWISQWLNDRLHFRPFRPSDRKRAKRMVKRYLAFSPGGECVVTLARVMDYHRRGVDGAVHLLPFTCMPELVAASILPTVTRDHPLPVLRLVIDEHTDGTGVRTRLEAFVDTLRARRTREGDGLRG